MRAKRLKAYSLLLLTIFIWGIASVVIKLTLEGIAPLPFLTYRFTISAIIALPATYSILKLLRSKHLRTYTLLYCFLSAPLALGVLFLGLDETSVINLSLVQAAGPLLLAYLGAHIFHDHLSKRGKIGVGIAIFGVLFTLLEPILGGPDGGTIKGNILLVIYLLSDIAAIIILKKLMQKHVSPIALTHLSFILAAITFLAISLSQNSLSSLFTQVVTLPIKYHLGVLYMAIFSGTIAYILRAQAQKTLTITETSIFSYLSPIISTLLALIFLKEHITSFFLVGAAFITIGVFLVEYKKTHKH